jgi:hypothetical protein
MGILVLSLVLAADEPVESLAKQMLPIYVKEAVEYSIAVESSPKKALELTKEPIFDWSNPVRSGLQQGVVFLWLRNERPAALCSVFSYPDTRLPGRQIIHEFHALDTEKLLVSRPGEYNQWKPQTGLARHVLFDAGTPAATAGARLVQMRRLAREFSGHSVDREGKHLELRLLPSPLYRYPAAETGVVDGALFALMSSAGTDPEVLLMIESREVEGKLRWEYACGRFSDWELRLQRKDKEVWSSVPGPTNPFGHDPQHLYRIYPEKIVNLEGKVLARIKQTAKGPEVTPVEDK